MTSNITKKITRLVTTAKDNAGFTLVEILLYMGLLSVFLVVLTDIFVATLETKSESEMNSAVQQDGRFILSRLSYDINRAESIQMPAALGENANTLSLTINGIVYSYTLSGSNLQISEGGVSGSLNSSETLVSDLNFHRLGAAGNKDTITVKFSLKSLVEQRGNKESDDFQTTVSRRCDNGLCN